MKKVFVLLLVLVVASLTFVGSALADENAPHLCFYRGGFVFPGETLTSIVYDASGSVVDSLTYTNNTSGPVEVPGYDYQPAVSGTEVVTISGSYGSFTFTYAVNDWGSGVCFDDGRLNSRPDRDLAAPVAVYFRSERGDGYGAVEVYDIDQVAGTGDLVLTITNAELEAAWHEALDSGASVIVAQYQDIVVYVVQDSDSGYAHIAVNAVEAREGKPYQFDFWLSFN